MTGSKGEIIYRYISVVTGSKGGKTIPSIFPDGKPVDYDDSSHGVISSFGYASFGSPVVIHLGSTGFFEGSFQNY